MRTSRMTATDLRRHLAGTLMRAKGCETVIVTYRGRPIMEVRPPLNAESLRPK